MKHISKMLENQQNTDITGNRLWMDHLKPVPGFCASRISYVRYKNVELDYLWRLDLHCDGKPEQLDPGSYCWTPSEITQDWCGERLHLQETKYITREDMFVSFLTVTNHSPLPCTVTFTLHTALELLRATPRATHNPGFTEWDNVAGEMVRCRFFVECHERNVYHQTLRPWLAIYAKGFKVQGDNCTLLQRCSLESGQSQTIRVVGRISHLEDFQQADLTDIAAQMDTQTNRRALQAWFKENVPDFTCSEPTVERMYYYRWYLVYKNLICPQMDCFNDFCFYEGKDQFGLPCTGPATLQINETRWLRDRRYLQGHLHNLFASQISEGRDDGRFRDIYLTSIPYALEQLALVWNDRQLTARYANQLERFLQWELRFDNLSDDQLPTVVGSWRTAAEYQPSFFEFTQPQWDHTQSAPFGGNRETAVKRVEEAVYLYQNLLAVAEMMGRQGNTAKQEGYKATAVALRKSILEKMWDNDTQFFYDLHSETGQKALQSKCFNGFLPFLGDICGSEYAVVFEHLENENEFGGAFPVPTVSRDCPAYHPDNCWAVGPHANADKPYQYDCCWNGPSWNFANSLVMDALGHCITAYNQQQYRSLFCCIFNSWVRAQYLDEQCTVANTNEHFHPDTGVQFRGVKDYFHSSFNDLMIRYIVGLTPTDSDSLILDPIPMGWESFAMENIPYRGHSVTVQWSIKDGMRVLVDGIERIHVQQLCRCSIIL